MPHSHGSSHAHHFSSRYNDNSAATGGGTDLSSEALQALIIALVKEFGTSVQSATQPDGSTIHTFADNSQARIHNGKATVLADGQPSDQPSDDDDEDEDED